ncbi:MAG: ATP-binding protein [Pseudomonadota bacterium]
MLFEGTSVAELLDAAPDAMIVVNRQGRIVLANRHVESMFGYQPNELLDRLIEDLLPERFRGEHARHRQGYARQPRRREMGAGLTLYGLRRDGSEFPVEISLNAFEMAEGTMTSAAIRDVSDQVRVREQLAAARDEAERANLAKSSFLAAASQDLRQPLQTLNLLNGVLSKTADCDHAERAVEQQAAALEAMSDLLNSLLDISKLESGAIKPDVGDCDVRDVFQRLSAEFSGQAEAKGLKLLVDNCSDIVRTDASLLEQMIQKLVANAIRYTREGLVQLRCLHMNDAVRIEVADTGVGIPPDQIEPIFNEFYQVDQHVDGSSGGLGLGLSVAQRLARLLDHPIDVESRPGSGSCFSVTLPRSVTNRSDDGAQPGLGVMLIDDDRAVIKATSMLLESDGHTVSIASTADEALAVARARGVPDVVIADLHLDDGPTGLHCIEQLRNFAGAELPAILLTGDTSAAVGTLVSEVPACRLLNKPVPADTLLDMISEASAEPARRTIQ